MTAFKRGKHGNQSIYVPTRSGALVQRSTGTPIPSVVRGMKRMVRQLKDENRWTILDALQQKRLTLRECYTHYTSNTLAVLDARLSSANLSESLNGWIAWVRANRQEGVRTADVYWQQVTTLIKPGEAFPASELNKARVVAWLSKVNGTSGTKRKYLYALKSFIRYLQDVSVLALDPLAGLKAPKKDPARK